MKHYFYPFRENSNRKFKNEQEEKVKIGRKENTSGGGGEEEDEEKEEEWQEGRRSGKRRS